MSTLDSRGFEVVSPIPVEMAIQFPDRPSVFDLVRQQVARALAERDRDVPDDDLSETDFTDDFTEVGDNGPYAIPDEIPDVLTPPPSMPEAPVKEDSSSSLEEKNEEI